MRCPASSASKEVVTAALLVIGGKILSGCTKDQNVGYIAEYLTAVDIQSRWNFGKCRGDQFAPCAVGGGRGLRCCAVPP
jgi:hypothetical protein